MVNSRFKKTGIKFPVVKTHRLLEKSVKGAIPVGEIAALYLASILEYLTAEVLYLAGKEIKSPNVERITESPSKRRKISEQITEEHLQHAIEGDYELETLFNSLDVSWNNKTAKE
ncbi:histone H2A variant 1-like protein [Trifolium pratense]|uniref:Uncharacterized protein n=3 Tax=Trifolium pratense TaxID=57577 RepID=A0ACB0JV62_TRIPR|nr:histone H2A variant 1-like protein [Trifolium pratense]CAJ2647488.1 unnamed protein product [Trifolium pratense]